MPNILTYPTRNANASCNPDVNNLEENLYLYDRYYAENRSCSDERSSAEFDFEDGWMTDNPEYADNYGLPIEPFTEDDLRFLRDFILSSAMYVEQLEGLLCDTSDDFWEAREHAYRIITALLIRHYEYELDG
jgi:hypothetical protein